MVNRFLASRPDLTAADRELLRGWRDPVEGIFEIRSKDRDSLLLLNLLDDLEYRMYSNISPAVFDPLPEGGFVFARLVPIRPASDAWLSSGTMSVYAESAAPQLAEIALDLATKAPELVYRNPERLKQGWEQMRADGYGLLRELFADPALAVDQQYADVLLGYLDSESIGPLPFRRLAAAHQKTVDIVFREILGKPKFSWAKHGEALMRQHKPWYFKRPPRPGFSPIGARLSELAGC